MAIRPTRRKLLFAALFVLVLGVAFYAFIGRLYYVMLSFAFRTDGVDILLDAVDDPREWVQSPLMSLASMRNEVRIVDILDRVYQADTDRHRNALLEIVWRRQENAYLSDKRISDDQAIKLESFADETDARSRVQIAVILWRNGQRNPHLVAIMRDSLLSDDRVVRHWALIWGMRELGEEARSCTAELKALARTRGDYENAEARAILKKLNEPAKEMEPR